jgi:hypothetical protein
MNATQLKTEINVGKVVALVIAACLWLIAYAVSKYLWDGVWHVFFIVIAWFTFSNTVQIGILSENSEGIKKILRGKR